MSTSNKKLAFDRWGKVISGPLAGKYVLVEPDPEETGGIFVFSGDHPDKAKCYDFWFLTVEDVEKHLSGYTGEIEWLSNGHDKSEPK